MRQIVLDTETTGLEPSEGHRIIEIGAVEVIDRRITGRSLQYYVNPGRAIDAGAIEVHGISNEFLADKPEFARIAEPFIDFIRDSELVIHNAPFDVGFLDAELARLAGSTRRVADFAEVLDTLELARRMHPGMKNSLDALCRRYEVDNAHRSLHGALLDAQILAEVYLRMTGGQTLLTLDMSSESESRDDSASQMNLAPVRVVRASDEELAEHTRRLESIDSATEGRCLWLESESEPAPG